jgi:TfoX/Sxy family transcriptional regulator of competence genes
MAYEEDLASRVRVALAQLHQVEEKRMFGGLTFMVGGHMCCGVLGAELMVRVGADAYAEAVDRPHARPMDFTGKPLRGMVFVDAKGTKAEADLEAWVDRGAAFVSSLPPKKKRTRKPS